MPTYDQTLRFRREFTRLTPARRDAFRAAVRQFLQDLPSRRFRAGLRVKRVRRAVGVYEITWAADGRATFEYADEVRPGHTHIIWRRIGTHDILDEP